MLSGFPSLDRKYVVFVTKGKFGIYRLEGITEIRQRPRRIDIIIIVHLFEKALD